MSNCLLLFTNYFPFYKGEEYLETELPILAQKFEKILIISCMIDGSFEQTREVPENVTLIPSGISHNWHNRLKMFIKSIGIESKEVRNLPVIHQIYSNYFEARSTLIANAIKIKLSNYDFTQYDNISIYSYWMYITARISIEIRQSFFKDNNLQLVSRAHGYDINEFINPLNFLPQREYILENVDYVFPISNFGTNYLHKKYPAYRDKIKTKRLGTQPANFRNIPDDNTFHIVSCSTIRKLKRIDLIIEAIEELQSIGFKVKWTHIGDGKLKDRMNELANEKLDRGSYNFTGYIPNDQIMNWYKENKSNLFINVSTSEGLPVSIMEAISIGLPIIATDVGGTKEIVKNHQNGLLLDKNLSEREVANAIIDIINLNADEYKEMSDFSLKIWEKEYNAVNNYKDFSNLLNKEGLINGL